MTSAMRYGSDWTRHDRRAAGSKSFILVTVLLAGLAADGGCSGFIEGSGPLSSDIVHGRPLRGSAMPYGLVRATPHVLEILGRNNAHIANVFKDTTPPLKIRFGIGDVVSVTIFEASAGGLFIPIEAGVRPGNFVQLPNQNVDLNGNIRVPYAGSIRALGRSPDEIESVIIDSLKKRAIEPQAIVALVTQNTSLISVLGDVNTPARFPANAAGEHVLDAIARAGGPKSQGFDTWLMLERSKRRAIVPFGALVYEPANNIWAHPGDTIYLYREPQTFVAAGAFAGAFTSTNGISNGLQGPFTFDAWRLSLAEAIAKAGGLLDTQADPSSVFVYRGETRAVAQLLGVEGSKFQGPIIPIIYHFDFRDPAGYFLATRFDMRNKDLIFAANAGAVEATKILNFIQLVTATVNDPIVAATNALILRNAIKTAP